MGEQRLGELCRKIVYDKIGEDALYEHFVADSHKLSQDRICLSETTYCQDRTRVQRSPAKTTTDKQAKAKKEKKERKAPEEALDANAFFAKLAVQHGLPKKEYTKKRGQKEWEKVVLAAAARISERGEVTTV